MKIQQERKDNSIKLTISESNFCFTITKEDERPFMMWSLKGDFKSKNEEMYIAEKCREIAANIFELEDWLL